MKALAAFVGLLLVARVAAAAGFESPSPVKLSRTWNSATLLSDGRVLVAGGIHEFPPLASTELYDPQTRSWSVGPSLHTGRRGHTATALPDGRVLVAGGSLATTFEVYDPSSGTWTVAGNLVVPRENHTASLLADGRVLLAGGLGSSPSRDMSHVEIYDPATGISTTTGSMTIARTRHTATVLADGRVLVVGGAVQVALGGVLIPWRAESYDPATGTWAETGTLVNLFDGHAAARLADGNVLVVGGYEPDTARIYDVAVGDFRPAASLHNGRSDHTATLLANGKVLVAHGYNYAASQALTVAELYDPASDSWSDAGWAFAPRFDSTATRLANDLVLFAGGNKTAGESELYNPLPPACLIQFASPTFRVNENAGAFELPVVRTGYCAGYTSVRFQACTGSGETATPNADYVLDNAYSIPWTPRDVPVQTIWIPIVNDTAAEADEFFCVALTQPVNAMLGANRTTKVFINDDDRALTPTLWSGTVVANPYGPMTVTGATLAGNALSNPQSSVTIQLGALTSGDPGLVLDVHRLGVGPGGSLTIVAGAPNQTVILRETGAAATSISGIVKVVGAAGIPAPGLHLHNPNGITVNVDGVVSSPAGLLLDALGATWFVGQPVVNHGVVDGGTSLSLMGSGVTGGGAWKGNTISLATFGNANNPAYGPHFLANSLRLHPSTGFSTAVVLNAYGTAPQFMNLAVKWDATLLMPSAPLSGGAPPNSRPVLPGEVRVAGVAEPSYGGGSLLIKSSGTLKLLPGASNDFVFAGGIVLMPDLLLDLNGVSVVNGWTTSGQAFQGLFMDAYIIQSTAPALLYTNDLNWMNFLQGHALSTNTFQLRRAGDGSAAYVPADTVAPHLNSYLLESEYAADGQCWTCVVNSQPVDMR